jgi:hypothetical protein
MLSGIFHWVVLRRELDRWLTDNYLRAAEALSQLAQELDAQAVRDIAAIRFFDSKKDFIALNLGPVVRSKAERLAHELAEQAQAEMSVLGPAQLFRLRVLNYMEPPVDGLNGVFRSVSDRLPFSIGPDLRERARAFIVHALISGTPETPSLLEQLERVYRDAAARALKLS